MRNMRLKAYGPNGRAEQATLNTWSNGRVGVRKLGNQEMRFKIQRPLMTGSIDRRIVRSNAAYAGGGEEGDIVTG
jgi:hypothetical protein